MGVVEDILRRAKRLKWGELSKLIRQLDDHLSSAANVGYSVWYFLREYPQATIDAFEPHPLHCARLEAHLRLNRDSGRVRIYPVAVGSEASSSKLTDAGIGSQIAACHAASLTVEVVDFFTWAGSTAIDLLKLDCEGAVYGLIMDDRFRALKTKTIVFEWRANDAHPHAETDIRTRLESLAFEVVPVSRCELPQRRFGHHAVGVAWAYS